MQNDPQKSTYRTTRKNPHTEQPAKIPKQKARIKPRSATLGPDVLARGQRGGGWLSVGLLKYQDTSPDCAHVENMATINATVLSVEIVYIENWYNHAAVPDKVLLQQCMVQQCVLKTDTTMLQCQTKCCYNSVWYNSVSWKLIQPCCSARQSDATTVYGTTVCLENWYNHAAVPDKVLLQQRPALQVNTAASAEVNNFMACLEDQLLSALRLRYQRTDLWTSVRTFLASWKCYSLAITAPFISFWDFVGRSAAFQLKWDLHSFETNTTGRHPSLSKRCF